MDLNYMTSESSQIPAIYEPEFLSPTLEPQTPTVGGLLLRTQDLSAHRESFEHQVKLLGLRVGSAILPQGKMYYPAISDDKETMDKLLSLVKPLTKPPGTSVNFSPPGNNLKYPWQSLQKVGDYFIMKGASLQQVSANVNYYLKKTPGKMIKCHSTPDGIVVVLIYAGVPIDA